MQAFRKHNFHFLAVAFSKPGLPLWLTQRCGLFQQPTLSTGNGIMASNCACASSLMCFPEYLLQLPQSSVKQAFLVALFWQWLSVWKKEICPGTSLQKFGLTSDTRKRCNWFCLAARLDEVGISFSWSQKTQFFSFRESRCGNEKKLCHCDWLNKEDNWPIARQGKVRQENQTKRV